jgi:hypothetical protein
VTQLQLVSVTFRAPVEIGREFVGHISAAQCGSLIADETARVVRVRGKMANDCECVPFELVTKYRYMPQSTTCPECGVEVQDARALGAHRRHKHGVKGGGAEEDE